MVGEFLELRCEASGFPTPKVTWYKDNQEIVADSNMRILEYGNSTSYLNITSINKNDEGEYVCRAKNPVPPFTTSADIYVTVKGERFALYLSCSCVARLYLKSFNTNETL